MKPNIFDISTKELSQDAFITWLLQWADSKAACSNSDLNKCGANFVRSLIRKEIPDFEEEIVTVRADRQWQNIDVWAKVNEKYFVIIEDKTCTGQHSGQLARYKRIAEEWCSTQSPKLFPPICIYLKTGNESQQSLAQVTEEGFKVFNRQEFLALLQNHDIKNDIYNDFKTRLFNIEQLNNEWDTKCIKDWDNNDWQGFFQFLEKEQIIIKWHHVNNPNGGFWNAVLNWDYWGIYPVYLQIEQDKLCFKISTDPAEPVVMPENETRGNIRNKINHLILESAKDRGILTIRRPNRFGSGKYMTVAVVDCENWLGKKDEKVNKMQVMKELLSYKEFLLDIINERTTER